MMTSILPCGLHWLFEQVYQSGRDFHGHLELSIERFTRHLYWVLEKHEKEDDAQAEPFLHRLHTDDLYLALACGAASNDAWQRFHDIYQSVIREAANYVCRNRTQADELAGNVFGHLFLPDASGKSRMLSFDGQASLADWLWAIIAYQRINDAKRKGNDWEPLENLFELADAASLEQILRAVRANRYGEMIRVSFDGAYRALSDQERAFVGMFYENALGVQEIAEIYETCKSNVSYHLKQARRKLNKAFVQRLQNQYHLSDEAIRECVEEVLENPAYSLLSSMKVER